MIKSFKHKSLKFFFETGSLKGIKPKHKNRLELILDLLDNIESVKDISSPCLGLHLLEPKHKNIMSVKVSGNWHITFKFENNNVYIVDYKDYH
jgi:proteic killer suppression protein